MCADSATLNQPLRLRSPHSLIILCSVLLTSLTLGSCVTVPPKAGAAKGSVSLSKTAYEPTVAYCRLPLADLNSAEKAPIWGRVREGFVLWDINHPRLEREIARLQSHPRALQGMLEQSRPWLHHIVDAVAERQLPMELALLPAVESGYQAYAHSSAGASGLWQFMPATGRMRGLTQDWWYDGRRDLIDGTEAALTHLEYLNQRLDGNWLHTLASYNAGRGTVNRAIRRNRKQGKPIDYWSLDLPTETDNYVPRLLALSAIIANPERYGVVLPAIADRPQFSIVETEGQIDLGVAADLAGMPTEDLAALNPGLNRLATPPEGPHRLLLPTDKVIGFQTALAKLPEQARLQRDRYQIKAGDTLSTIAERYDISVNALKQTNGLNSNRIRVGKFLLIPRYPSALALAPASTPKLPHSRVRYRVRQGDSLYEIAQRFHVSVGQLRRWNRLSGSLVKPGQRLTLYVDPAKQTL